jgi:hypothetical protein
MMEIGSSGNRDIGRPNLTTKAGDSLVFSVVNCFSVLTVFALTTFGNFGIVSNSRRIGVSS